MKKKLLYLVPSHSSYKKPIGDAFKKLGWDVKYFDYRKGDIPIRILRFLPIIGGFKKASEDIDRKIVKICSSYKPEIILTAKGELLSEKLLKDIKNERNVTVNLYPDYLNHWDSIKEISRYYDFFFTFDPTTIKALKKLGRKNIYYMPQATEPEEKILEDKKYDISFIGTFNPWRVKYLSVLKNLGLNIWGDKRWYNTELSSFVRGGRIPLKKMKKIIKQTKININIFFDDETIMEGVSLRPYEITGSGGFLLSQYVKDYDNVFINKKEMVYFDDAQEMKKLAEYYIKHDKERELIASNGYQRTLKDHTYEVRMQQMLDIINRNINKTRS